MSPTRNPYILGKPIRDPADFYGRNAEMRELFESVANQQPVALIGEHRSGNTSILYQMQNEEVQARYLPGGTEGLLIVYANAQLATEGPEALFRRLARALRRQDSGVDVDLDEAIDQFWIEDYLEELADRGRRLVLLLDEFDVLADFPSSFWEWFRGLITEYDLSIVVASRVELGSFRDEWGIGSPFFNMFRTIYVGSFTTAELETFLAGTSEVSGVDIVPMRSTIEALGGRFPYYVQVAAAIAFDVVQSQPLSASSSEIEAMGSEFRQRVAVHFDDIWSRLPDLEREALAWLAADSSPRDRAEVSFRQQALPSLERRGYVYDGRIFSLAFRDFIQSHIPRIELNVETGAVRIERRPVELPPKEFALLKFLLDNEGEVVTKDEIALAVWPEYQHDTLGVTDAMIQKTISRLRKEVDVVDSDYQHIESVRGQGYRFQNASLFALAQHNGESGVALEA
jgi:DNA-binding winged helix-turn-helix (wHTH) protein